MRQGFCRSDPADQPWSNRIERFGCIFVANAVQIVVTGWELLAGQKRGATWP
jgi:hypothetical protein